MNNAEEAKKSENERKPRSIESAGEEEDNDPFALTTKKNKAENDNDVVTSAPELKDLNLAEDENKRLQKEREERGMRAETESALQMMKEASAEALREEEKARDTIVDAEPARDTIVDAAPPVREGKAPLPLRVESESPQAEEAREKAELRKEMIEAAGSIDAIKNIVDQMGVIETSDGTKMTATEVKQWIDMAVQFPDSIAIGNITRSYGLREKVKELTKGVQKEQRIEARGQRVDAAMQEEDEQKQELEKIDAGWDEIAADQKSGRIDAMEKRVDADMATDAELDDFLKRGKVIDQLHTAGQSTEKNTMREGIGELNAKEFEVAEKAIADLPVIDEQLARTEKALADRGISDVTEAHNKRAIDGFVGKAKGFFGGLFNKKAREVNGLMETYSSLLEARNKAQETIDNRKMHTEKSKRGGQIGRENRG